MIGPTLLTIGIAVATLAQAPTVPMPAPATQAVTPPTATTQADASELIRLRLEHELDQQVNDLEKRLDDRINAQLDKHREHLTKLNDKFYDGVQFWLPAIAYIMTAIGIVTGVAIGLMNWHFGSSKKDAIASAAEDATIQFQRINSQFESEVQRKTSHLEIRMQEEFDELNRQKNDYTSKAEVIMLNVVNEANDHMRRKIDDAIVPESVLSRAREVVEEVRSTVTAEGQEAMSEIRAELRQVIDDKEAIVKEAVTQIFGTTLPDLVDVITRTSSIEREIQDLKKAQSAMHETLTRSPDGFEEIEVAPPRDERPSLIPPDTTKKPSLIPPDTTKKPSLILPGTTRFSSLSSEIDRAVARALNAVSASHGILGQSAKAQAKHGILETAKADQAKHGASHTIRPEETAKAQGNASTKAQPKPSEQSSDDANGQQPD